MPGKRLGPYEILADIGAGGMGEVYKSPRFRSGCVCSNSLTFAAAVDSPMVRCSTPSPNSKTGRLK